MEAIANESGELKQWRMKLLDLLQMFRRPDMERDLAEAKAWIGWQKDHTEQIQQRYDALDRKCMALSNEVESLRSRLYAAEQQAEAFKRVACSAIGTAEDFKRIYEAFQYFKACFYNAHSLCVHVSTAKDDFRCYFQIIYRFLLDRA